MVGWPRPEVTDEAAAVAEERFFTSCAMVGVDDRSFRIVAHGVGCRGQVHIELLCS